ncbi:MAG: AbrB family transcriptional regulator [Gammaproteobacteria bacterium RBG_16_51_14]|nr:MAG: AbrB family transcriptional regulator [Gammaproteobacteria bacterium RBG_16_51_14]
MMATVITSKGQVTIPKALRDKLKLHAGDRLDFIVESDGTARLVPVTASIKELKGLVPKPKRKLSLEDMENAIAKGASKT